MAAVVLCGACTDDESRDSDGGDTLVSTGADGADMGGADDGSGTSPSEGDAGMDHDDGAETDADDGMDGTGAADDAADDGLPECLAEQESCEYVGGGPLAPTCCPGLTCERTLLQCVDEDCIPTDSRCSDDPADCCGGVCRQDGTCGATECVGEGEGCGGGTQCCEGFTCTGNDPLGMSCVPSD